MQKTVINLLMTTEGHYNKSQFSNSLNDINFNNYRASD